MKREFIENIIRVQEEISVPKNQRNDFGGFNYRSAEDILMTAKPILSKYGLLLTLTDELINEGDRYYIKATATITDGEETMTTTALARECSGRSGFDEAQITGTASSYARKYALNGLFCLDDNKDVDSLDNGSSQPAKQPAKEEYTLENLKAFCRRMVDDGNPSKYTRTFYDFYAKKIEGGTWKGKFDEMRLYERWLKNNWKEVA